VVAAATEHLSRGLVRLDPTVRTRGRLATRWGLWINSRVGDPATRA
jgi:hypothetical protein